MELFGLSGIVAEPETCDYCNQDFCICDSQDDWGNLSCNCHKEGNHD